MEEHGVALLAGQQRVEDQVVAVAHELGVVGVLDAAGVIRHHGDEDDLAGLHVVHADAEAGLDLGAEVHDGEGLEAGGAEDALGVGGLEELRHRGAIAGAHEGSP